MRVAGVVSRLVLMIGALSALTGTPMGAQSSAQSGGASRFDAWGVAYTVPSGWQLAQRQGRVHGLTPSAQGSVIYVAPGLYQSFSDVATELPKAFTALGLTGTPTGQPTNATINGMQAMSASYGAQSAQGALFEVRVTAVLSAHGSGVVVMGVAPSQGSAQLRTAVEQVSQSIVVSGAPTPDPRAVSALRGKWIFYSGKAEGVLGPTGGSSRSYEETIEFDGASRYGWQSTASVSATVPGGSASGGNASSDQGSYTVIGTTLFVRGQQGIASYEVQILADRIIADGRTYFRNN